MDAVLIVTTALSGVWGDRLEWLESEAGKGFWEGFRERVRMLGGDSPMVVAAAEAQKEAGRALHAALAEASERHGLTGTAKEARGKWLANAKAELNSLQVSPQEPLGDGFSLGPGNWDPPRVVHNFVLYRVRRSAPPGEPNEFEGWVEHGWPIRDRYGEEKFTYWDLFQLHYRVRIVERADDVVGAILGLFDGLDLPPEAEEVTEESLREGIGRLLSPAVKDHYAEWRKAKNQELRRALLAEMLGLQAMWPERIVLREDDPGVEPNENLIADLKEKIGRGEVVLVVGAGVSIGATGKHPSADWKGLLKHGIDHCRDHLHLEESWAKRRKEDLEDDLKGMLLVAEDISDRLEAPDGEFYNWLRSVFEAAHYPLVDSAVIEALDRLECPIVTTNYDDLIERVTGREWVVWNYGQQRLSFILSRQDKAVVHLHGHWNAPDSVVLGIRDYEKVKNDEHTQAFMRVVAMAKCLLFVGCGAGMKDPNFEALLKWLGVTKGKWPERSYRLARSSEVRELQAEHPLRQRIAVLSYGKKHADLAGFLERLAPPRAEDGEEGSGELSDGWKKYLTHLAGETETMPLVGLGSGITVSLPIEEAYIPLRTCQVERFDESPGKEKYDLAEHARAERAVPDLPLSGLFESTARRGALLLGDPGAGKTTGLRQWCWRLASGEALPEDFGLPARCLPVFLKLRKLPEPDALFRKSRKQFFARYLQEEVRVPQELGEDLALAEEVCACRAPLLWLVDGLDEVADVELRKAVFKWLGGILKQRGEDRILVAGRFQGVEGVIERGAAFARFEVQPLSAEQSQRFVRAWFDATYGELGQPPGKAREKSEALTSVLESETYRDIKLQELKSNPLLLTILCVVYHEDAKLPEERAKVYDRCVRVLLESWREDRGQSGGRETYDAEAARSLLGRVAWWLHGEERRRAVAKGEMEEHAGKQLSLYPNAELPETGARFVKVMKDQAGMLAAVGDGKVEFVHLTFQEYLAADHATRENLGRELAEFFGVDWWREVTLLALSQGSLAFSESFFGELLKKGAVEREAGFFEQCLRAAQAVDWTSFAAALRKASEKRRLPLLRVLRGFTSPEVVAVCRELHGQSKSEEVRVLAGDILRRAGEQVAEEEAAPEEVGEWVHAETGMIFVRIPAGTFMMGSPEDEVGRDVYGDLNFEKQHEVTLSEDFWIAKYPVTNEVYEKFVKAVGHRSPSEWDDSRFNQPSQPVVGVSWEDAEAFCEWIGGRLPTEAQWEYACRAGTATPFAIGDGKNISSELANFDGNYPYGNAKKGPYLEKTSPVGSYEPNGWGLYDMHGNVWEWCRDWVGDYPEGSVEDPEGPEAGERRVLRGGSWIDDGRYCRSADRRGNGPGLRLGNVGFRPVQVRILPSFQPASQPAEPERT